MDGLAQIAEWDDAVVSGEIPTREQMWSNLDYFLRRVMPAAEEHGVMLAMHPVSQPHLLGCYVGAAAESGGWQDDPPLSSIRGAQFNLA